MLYRRRYPNFTKVFEKAKNYTYSNQTRTMADSDAIQILKEEFTGIPLAKVVSCVIEVGIENKNYKIAKYFNKRDRTVRIDKRIYDLAGKDLPLYLTVGMNYIFDFDEVSIDIPQDIVKDMIDYEEKEYNIRISIIDIVAFKTVLRNVMSTMPVSVNEFVNAVIRKGISIFSEYVPDSIEVLPVSLKLASYYSTPEKINVKVSEDVYSYLNKGAFELNVSVGDFATFLFNIGMNSFMNYDTRAEAFLNSLHVYTKGSGIRYALRR